MSMISKRIKLVVISGILSAGCSAPIGSDEPASAARSQAVAGAGARDPRLARRAEIAASGRYLARAAAIAPRVSGNFTPIDWTSALDIDVPAADVHEATLIGRDVALGDSADIVDHLGIIKPLRGDKFVLLSTGVAGTHSPEPGQDFPPTGIENDSITLRVRIKVPLGANLMSLQYNFLSTESPDFKNTEFNDTFSIQLLDDGVPRDPVPLATVNSSEFVDVSDSRAKDTGFAIFTPDPADVDLDFPGGLPDAGLTDFQGYTTSVTGGEELTMLLTIADAGDGILDSAVLIDAVQFSSIEAVDPNFDHSPLLSADGTQITGTDDELATLGTAVRGAIADGATEVVLRVKTSGPRKVDFAVVEGASGGTLTDLSGGSAAGIPTRPTLAGDYAFALYHAPADFVHTADDAALAERKIQLTATVHTDPDDGLPVTSQLDFQLRRPPVVLARGMWTQLDDWYPDPTNVDAKNDLRFLVNNQVFAVSHADELYYACDVQQAVFPVLVPNPCGSAVVPALTCGPSTDEAVSSAVATALAHTRLLHVAATRVDVIGHGAGGLAARRYIQTADYENKTNLGQGTVNRLITLNTPHFGSRLAEKVIAARTISDPVKNFACNQRQIRVPVEQGSVDAITRNRIALDATPVPSHAFIGTGILGAPTNDSAYARKKLIDVGKMLTNATLTLKPVGQPLPNLFAQAFDHCDHDLFADVLSQGGGIPEDAVSRHEMTDEHAAPTIHRNDVDSSYFRSIRNPVINQEIQDLLNTPIATPKFDHFPASTNQQCDPAVGSSLQARAERSLLAEPASLRIVSPAEGTEFVAGDTITVEVAAENFVPVSVVVFAGGTAVSSETPPFTTQVEISKDTLGPFTLIAFAVDATGDEVVSDVVTLTARTNAVVQAVRVLTQDPILFRIGAQYHLTVVADYDDGVTRNITSSPGTVYLTSNPAVVTVAADGTLTAIGNGAATVIAQSGTVQDSTTVRVQGGSAPVARAGADAALVCAPAGQTTPVQLDGSASFDPDGEPLAFSWLEDGVTVATGATPSVGLLPGIHTLELVVSDATSTGHDTVVVSVLEDTAPPQVTVVGDNPATTECGAAYQDGGATALDGCDGDLTAAIQTTSHVNPGIAGSYSVDYQVHDKAGLTGAASRVVLVTDHTAPSVTVKPMKQLFPPDFLYRTFRLSDCAAAVDSCGGPLDIDQAGDIVAIHSDEPDKVGPFDPDHDIVIQSHSRFKLRNQSLLFGNGRVYEIEFTVHDSGGNTTAPRSCFIGVRSLLHPGPPINDGRVFTVRPEM